jgi:hypothetical protein
VNPDVYNACVRTDTGHLVSLHVSVPATGQSDPIRFADEGPNGLETRSQGVSLENSAGYSPARQKETATSA